MKFNNAFVALWTVFMVIKVEALTPEQRDDRPFCNCEKQDYIGMKVVGGFDANEDEFPFASGLIKNIDLLMNRMNQMTFSPFCGGTLITDRHVLTAAHCVKRRDPTEVALTISDFDLSDGKAVLRTASNLFIFPFYDDKSMLNDIAVIEFEEPVTFGFNDHLGTHVRTAWLPPPGIHMQPPSTATVYGWGRLDYFSRKKPTILQTLTMPMATYEKCKKAFSFNIYQDMMICVGGQAGKDACTGDSGSGLLAKIQETDDQPVLIGVVSFGQKCALPDVPGIYTNVSTYVDWIYENTKSAGCQPCIAI